MSSTKVQRSQPDVKTSTNAWCDFTYQAMIRNEIAQLWKGMSFLEIFAEIDTWVNKHFFSVLEHKTMSVFNLCPAFSLEAYVY